ncbi:Homeobox protein yox1 [Emydomyces testavorans]|uniref:Homeobox protein yox1 n=1 Tax=Emydomyces testavorans TaxID=2070801 RepID=A0AAF0IHG6_9EURO|nr:Homeobox protein yox1 [Emydomyces testavorans]
MSDSDCKHIGNEPSSSNHTTQLPHDGSFLVHSNKTLAEGQPPKVDNKALSRQRRRRTSPEDYAILEAEYQRNPKPGREKRASIVSRVSLGDKEVQIWFQNRRQNDRRRSKPLQPHELLPSSAARTNSQKGKPDNKEDLNSQDPSVSATSSFHSQNHDEPNQPAASSSFEHANERDEANSSLQISSSQATIASTQTEKLEDGNTNNEVPYSSEGSAVKTEILQNDPQQQLGSKRKWDEFSVHELVEAKYARRSLPSQLAIPPSLRVSLSFDGEAIVRREGEKTPSPPKPRDSLRISFSADGEAVVRTANEPSPSKTSSKYARFGQLRRSTSAVSFPAMGSTMGPKDAKPFGRSRDARTWEQYCDNDARTALSTALTTRTDSTTSNNLSRRNSPAESSKPLAPRSNLPNVTMQLEVPTEKRRKLTRAMSSLARLESGTKAPTVSGVKSKEFGDPILKDHSGDSDKENWIPGTQISSVRRRSVQQRPAQTRSRRILGQSSKQLEANRPSSARLKRGRSVKTAQPNEKENQSAIVCEGEEASALVKEAGSNPEEDLDCVQGLLSLSQGAWR